jgi:hypothetical protein
LQELAGDVNLRSKLITETPSVYKFIVFVRGAKAVIVQGQQPELNVFNVIV